MRAQRNDRNGGLRRGRVTLTAAVVAAAAAVAGVPSGAVGQTRTWDGGTDADNNWSTADNWSTNTAPPTTANFEGWRFGTSTSELVTEMDNPYSFGQIQFNNAGTPGAVGYVVNSAEGNTMSLAGQINANDGVAIFMTSVTGSVNSATINVPVAFVTSTQAGATNAARVMNILSGTLTINGAVTSPSTLPVRKTGAGTVVLGSAANSFSTYQANNGATQLATDTSLGAAEIVVGTGNVARVTPQPGSGDRVLANNVTLSTDGASAGTLVLTTPNGPSMTLNGTVTASVLKGLGVETGTTAVINGRITGAGGISKENPGTLVLNGANDNAGGFVLGNGTVRAATDAAFGAGGAFVHNTTNGGVLLADGGARTFANPVTLGGSGTLQFGAAGFADGVTFTGPVTLVNRNVDTAVAGDEAKPLTVAAGTTATFTGGIGDAGASGSIGAGIGKGGPGTLVLGGASTYTGPTNVASGTLVVDGSIAASSATTVTGLAGTPGKLNGSGTVGPLFLSSGGIVSPGTDATAADLAAASASLGEAGRYLFNLNDATAAGTPGAGWDFLDVSGTITASATSGAPFVIDVEGAGAGFDATRAYSIPIAEADGGIVGFDAAKFVVEDDGFTAAGDGSFAVAQVGNTLNLNYTPVPEPGALSLLGLAGLGLLARRRR